MKGRPKSVVINRKRTPKTISSTYNHQATSSLSRRSVISPHYKKTQIFQTEVTKDTKNSVSPHFYSVIDDPKLEALRESVERDGNFNDIEDKDLKLLLAHTREYQQTCAAERKYEKANDAKELLEKIKEEMNMRKETLRQDEDAIELAENQKKQKSSKYKQQMEDFNEETEKMQQFIKEKQDKEREKFENVWRDLNPRKYQKSSASLLQMKEIEKNLILTGEYLKAKEAHQRILQVTNIEIQQRQIDLNEDYANAKEQLRKKQENQIEVFKQSRKEQSETYKVQRKKEMQIMDNRMKVVKQKSIGTRCPRSTNTSNTDNYATSFQHIAKEKNFGIDPLLPKLGPPSDKRQYRIKATKNKSIVVNAPRAYLPKNDKYFESSDDQNPVFETSVNKSQLKRASDDDEYETEEEEQKDILKSQIEAISKSLNDYENNNENDLKVEDKNEDDEDQKEDNENKKEDNENKKEDNENKKEDHEDKNEEHEDKGILGNMFSNIANTVINDDDNNNVNNEEEEKKEEAVPRSYTDLVASIVSNT